METKLAQYDKSLTQTTTCINEHLSRHPSCSCNRSNTRKKIWINTDDWAEQDRQLQEKLKSSNDTNYLGKTQNDRSATCRNKVEIKADDWAEQDRQLQEKLKSSKNANYLDKAQNHRSTTRRNKIEVIADDWVELRSLLHEKLEKDRTK